MEINYELLISLSILPILNKVLFWFFTIQLKEYRFDRFKEYLFTNQWKKAIFNFLFYIEFPVFIFVFWYYFSPLFEKMAFQVVIYLLLIESVFVLSKMLRRKMIIPKFTSRLIFTSIIFIIIELFFYFILSNQYLFILLNLIFNFFFIFLSVFVSLPLVNHLKNKRISTAKKISKEVKNPIKIGITWSYWKSSIKEYLTQILEKQNKVLSTPKNINTEIWISDLIIKKLKNKYDYFIAEMWAYKIWEIETLWEIVDHKYGFLTAIWTQHLSLFWWIKNIIKAKSEIANKVLENKWILYVNWDNKNISKAKFSKKLNIVTYWIKETCDAKSDIIWIKDGITKFDFYYKWTKTKYKTNLPWTHNIINITWILAFCYDIWIDKDLLKEALLDLKMPENTLYVINTKDNIFIDDTYNLSEWWLLAWLETLSSFTGTREKILIVDDILELWDKAKDLHFELWRKIWKNKLCDKVLYVWINYKKEFTKWLITGWFKFNDIIDDLNKIKKDDILLFEWRRAKLNLNQILWKKY